MTTVYLIRHSEKYNKSNYLSINTSQNNQLLEEKVILSVNGEKMAESLSNKEEFYNLDSIYTSNCVRTLQTAKYFIEKSNIRPIIDDRFDERRIGIPNDKEYPDWYFRQFKDKDFKTIGGESVNDTFKRFNEAFKEVIKNNKGKRVAIFTHGNAMLFFLINFLDSYKVNDYKNLTFMFKGKKIFQGKINFLDTFKLELDDKGNISEIKVIRYE